MAMNHYFVLIDGEGRDRVALPKDTQIRGDSILSPATPMWNGPINEWVELIVEVQSIYPWKDVPPEDKRVVWRREHELLCPQCGTPMKMRMIQTFVIDAYVRTNGLIGQGFDQPEDLEETEYERPWCQHCGYKEQGRMVRSSFLVMTYVNRVDPG
jgi:hypothetical protein